MFTQDSDTATKWRRPYIGKVALTLTLSALSLYYGTVAPTPPPPTMPGFKMVQAWVWALGYEKCLTI